MTSFTSGSAKTAFVLPELWSFPPFFTIQTVSSTREKQLKLWKDLVLNFCICNNMYNLNVSTFPYFKNDAINRKLSPEGIEAVVNYLITEGNGEWEDRSNASLRLIWRTPEALAAEVYTWGCNVDIIGTVFTVYEIHAGEDYQDSGFYGVDPVLLRRALTVLEANKKCRIIPGSSSDEDGVKFLSAS
jgi:ESCRT-II complex subunit VPS25